MAQTAQRFSIQGSALYVVPGGSEFADTKAGPGAELQLRANTPIVIGSGVVSIGGGGQFSTHSVEGLTDPLYLFGAFVEPRYAFAVGGTALYLSVRAALFRQSQTSQGVTGSANGNQLNAGGGLLMRLSRNVNLDLGATFGVFYFGSYTVTYAEGGGFTRPALSGTNVVMRGGLAIGLGGS
jgi:hypothetical protein